MAPTLGICRGRPRLWEASDRVAFATAAPAGGSVTAPAPGTPNEIVFLWNQNGSRPFFWCPL
jgi:hypothetical protein